MSDLFPGASQPQRVNDFHTASDLDVGDLSQHHTLGYGNGQAAPGSDVSRRLAALEDPTFFKASNTTNAQSLPNGVQTTLTTGWTNPTLSPYFSAYSNGVWTFAQPGVYLLSTEICFGVAASGERYVTFIENTFTELAPRGSFVGPNRFCGTVVQWAFLPGDTVEIAAYQTSGAALAMTAAARRFQFNVRKLASI